MNSNQYILVDENSWENYLISILSLFYPISIKIFIVYAYFTYVATASKITDDVTKLVMHRVFITNLDYSATFFTHIFDKNIDYLTSLNKIQFVKNVYYILEFMRFSNTMVSRGSAVTSLRYGAICDAHSVANCVLRIAVEEFCKSINISRSYRHE